MEFVHSVDKEIPATEKKAYKIIDVINSKKNDTWISLEFYPPRTENAVNTLYKLVEKMKAICSSKNPDYPLFVDFTWGAGGSTSELTFELCKQVNEKFGLVPNMHLTCTNMDKEKVDAALESCKSAGLQNIVALRGDPPVGQEKWEVSEGGFTCALDLVTYTRQKYGDFFCLSVAGYPEGHPNKFSVVEGGLESLTDTERLRCCTQKQDDGTEILLVCKDADFESELDYLKAKVDAGADIILTQMFFDVEVYGHFVRQCREKGINVPIVPGLMCIANYGGFKRMVGFCKTRVPAEVWARLEAIKDEPTKIEEYGIEFGIATCRRLIELGAPGLHYYTLNMGHVTLGILEGLGFIDAQQPVTAIGEKEVTVATALPTTA